MEEPVWAAAHQRRVAHALHGIVSSVDPANHAVKVRLQPDNVETGWLPDTVLTQVGRLRVSCPCATGTHVLLLPVEGDGENFVVVSALFDVVAPPPRSPLTGEVARPGEMLICAGYESGAHGGKPAEGAGWLHLGHDDICFGAGELHCLLGQGAIMLRAGSVEMKLDGSGLSIKGGGISVSGGDVAVSGGEVRTALNTLGGHVHPAPNGMTGKPVG